MGVFRKLQTPAAPHPGQAILGSHCIRNTKTIERSYLYIIHNIAKLKYNILITDFRKERNNLKIRITKYIFNLIL